MAKSRPDKGEGLLSQESRNSRTRSIVAVGLSSSTNYVIIYLICIRSTCKLWPKSQHNIHAHLVPSRLQAMTSHMLSISIPFLAYINDPTAELDMINSQDQSMRARPLIRPLTMRSFPVATSGSTHAFLQPSQASSPSLSFPKRTLAKHGFDLSVIRIITTWQLTPL